MRARELEAEAARLEARCADAEAKLPRLHEEASEAAQVVAKLRAEIAASARAAERDASQFEDERAALHDRLERARLRADAADASLAVARAAREGAEVELAEARAEIERLNTRIREQTEELNAHSTREHAAHDAPAAYRERRGRSSGERRIAHVRPAHGPQLDEEDEWANLRLWAEGGGRPNSSMRPASADVANRRGRYVAAATPATCGAGHATPLEKTDPRASPSNGRDEILYIDPS